ncbi:MAG: carboxymuconolactone decarboxylase family protein [Ectothiorhodospiraceae bacterium AqS1]|nr:carboxymuconolactone decarboxylase family protein [Ectothiorhodospiraceae bacterium AqS1]
MAIVSPLEEQEIEETLAKSLQFFKGPLGVIPNSVRTMAHRPQVAAAFTALNIAVMECHGQVTPEFKRLLGYATSFVSGCRYCQAHTILGAERFGSSNDRLESVWNFENSPCFSEAEKAALAFARAAASVPGEVDEPIVEALRAHWSDGDIVEITAVIALFGYLNRWNDSMGTALEELPIGAGEKYLARDTGWEVGKHR